MNVRMLSLAMMMVVALGVAACGFQLRDDVQLPDAMNVTFIEYTGTDSDFLRTIARSLSLSGVDVVSDVDAASAILHVKATRVRNRIVAKDELGRAREYEVTVQLIYAVLSPERGVIVSEQEVQARDFVVLDPLEPLANKGLLATAIEALREEVVWDMLHRIAASPVEYQPDEGMEIIDEPAQDTAGQ